MSDLIESQPTKRRGVRIFCFVVAALATVIGLFYAVENWRGARAWAAAQAMVKARGECLDLSCVVAPPIPDELNFARTPAIAAGLTLVPQPNQPVGFSSSVLDSRPEAVAARARLHGFFLKEPGSKKKKEQFARGHLPNGRLDLAAWRDAQDDNTNFVHLAASSSAAADILALLGQKEPLLSELSSAAEQRPDARYSTHPEDLYAALLPHLGWGRRAALAFAVRSAARLAQGDRAGAFADARTTFRLGETFKSEPYLVTQMVRFACHREAHRALAEGLAEHAWTDAQLAEWQRLETATDFKAGMMAAFRMERSASCLTIEQVSRHPALASELFGSSIDSGGNEHVGIARIPYRLVPTGWWRQNQASVVRFYQPILDHAVAAPPGLLPEESTGEADFLRYAAASGPYSEFSRRLVPALAKAFTKANRATMTSRLAIVACALERHRLKHGIYPVTLAELEPGALNGSVPLDLDGQPVRYQRTDDGWYKLYSLGPNGRDDDGEFRDKGNDLGLDWPWPVPVGEGPRLF